MKIKELTELGFIKNRVIETIFLTRNDDSINIAPIGVTRKNNHLKSNIYHETHTYLNLIKNKHFSINLTNKPEIFYKAIFDKDIEIKEFRLKESFASIIGKAKEKRKKETKSVFNLIPEEVEKKDFSPKLISRAETAIIEALVYYTKIPNLDKSHCIEKIESYKEIIEKTGSKKDLKMIKDIKKKAIKR